MADQSFQESLDGGLNNAEDPGLLGPGELAKCANAYYRYDQGGVYPALTTGTYNNATGGNITGMAPCVFDNGTQQLVVQVGTAYKYGTFGLSSTLSNYSPAETITAGNQLVAVPYQNRYYLFNGANVNRVLTSNGTVVRGHGLAPVTLPPDAQVSTGAWPLGASGFGYYEYWITEVYKTSTETLESTVLYANSVRPPTVNITAITQAVTVTRPSVLANSAATHWRVYRSVVKTLLNEQVFPDGVLVSGDLPISDSTGAAVTTFLDGTSATVGYSAAQAGSTVTVTTGTSGSWVGATLANIQTQDAVFAEGIGVALTLGFRTCLTIDKFGLSSVTDPISGLGVEIYGKSISIIGPGQGQVYAAISVDGGTTFGTDRVVTLTGTNALHEIGGDGQTVSFWGAVLSASGFSDANFRLRLSVIGHSYIDRVRVKVFYSGSLVGDETPFPVVDVSINGVNASVGEDGQPPISSTGDVFEGALVMNDTSQPSYVWWSSPGKPDSVPTVYFIDIETPDNDVVTCIKTLGNRCLVGLKNSLWRMNFIPTENDASFDRGNALDVVDPSFGVVGPLAMTSFINPDGRPEMAYVSNLGLRGTDGFTSHVLSDDVDWVSLLSPLWNGSQYKIQLWNNPNNYELIMMLPVSSLGSGAWASQFYHFSYAPRHIKPGGHLKVSGPMDYGFVANTSGANVMGVAYLQITSSRNAIVYLGTAGDSGKIKYLTSPVAGTTLAMDVRTRVMYQAGLGNEWQIKEVYPYVSGGQGSLGGSACALTGTMTVQGVERGGTWSGLTDSKSVTLTQGALNKVVWARTNEGIQVALSLTGFSGTPTSQPGIPHLTIRGEDFGGEDSK